MSANFCGDNAVAGTGTHVDGRASSQSTEGAGVMPAQGWGNELESEDFSPFALAIPKRPNEMRTRAAESTGANSNNSWAFNELGTCEPSSDGEIAHTKCRESVRPSTLVRWLRFNFVGGIGIGVQFVALLLTKNVLHFDYLAATVLAVEAAVVHNFVWHEQFTWADRTRADCVQASWRRSLARLVRFNLTTGGVSIVGNLALMKVMVGVGHMNYLLANGIAIALCSLANFLVSEEWVFAKNSGPLIHADEQRLRL